MAAAPENDILTRLDNIENAIIPILEDLRGDDVPWDIVHGGIMEVCGMIQDIINHNDEHQVILDDMMAASRAAALAVDPQDPRLDRSENDAIIALNEVIDLINDLRSQHVGGYRKRRTNRKRRTHRKRRNRKRTHRNRK